MADDLARLQQTLRDFVAERNWEQFHKPKNLAMAVAGEAGELVAEMQWMSDREIADALSTGDLRSRVSQEAADVFIYLLRLAEVCGFDLVRAAHIKIEINEDRYPVDLAKGHARKYDDLEGSD
jgi:dCTP diphosphatase